MTEGRDETPLVDALFQKLSGLDSRSISAAWFEECRTLVRSFERSLAQAQARIGVLESEEPGTPLGRIAALARYAEQHCGYSPVGAKGPEQVIFEHLERQAATIRELEKDAARYKWLREHWTTDYPMCSINWQMPNSRGAWNTEEVESAIDAALAKEKNDER